MNNAILLTPGFSPVMAGHQWPNRFNGLACAGKPLKRLEVRVAGCTRLKPGVNETANSVAHICETQ